MHGDLVSPPPNKPEANLFQHTESSALAPQQARHGDQQHLGTESKEQQGPQGSTVRGALSHQWRPPLSQRGGGLAHVVWQHACVRTFMPCPSHTHLRLPSLSRAKSLGHHPVNYYPRSESRQEGTGGHGLGKVGSQSQMAPRALELPGLAGLSTLQHCHSSTFIPNKEKTITFSNGDSPAPRSS